MSLLDSSSKNLRKRFLEFFNERGHKVMPSSSLLPENDPSVLFTTAGMQQFKRFYSNPEEAPAASIATCQKCIRTGDIEEVGDETHLTFFEMLGNFSFGYPEKSGSYFKKEAIEMAWEFLTGELKVEKKRISCTYFAGDKGIPEDHESHKLLKNVTGLEDAKILGTGFDETFWSLGTEGSPGGPTVEFYIDGVEIWNLVFNEYKFENGEYVASKLKGVDTGMGLERLVAVLQKRPDIYQTDIFQLQIKEIEKMSGLEYGDKSDQECDKCWVDTRKAFRIIADHIKAAVFLINEGTDPSNKTQGYVLRRLIRRAIVQGFRLNINSNFLILLPDRLYEIYKGQYQFDEKKIEGVIDGEERRFGANLKAAILEIDSYQKHFQENSSMKVDGHELFYLYQSRGLPLEIALEEIRRRGIGLEDNYHKKFNENSAEHQEKSRTASAGMFKGGLESGSEQATRYHTATHLLLAALREVLGDDVYQKGSNITTERLRFDFSHSDKMTEEQIKKVEDIVNEKIKEALPVMMEEMPVFEAKKSGAMGEFAEKYTENVKVYSIGNYSKEICGGPHVKNTSELGHFKITKEESSSSGVRRIKAILEKSQNCDN